MSQSRSNQGANPHRPVRLPGVRNPADYPNFPRTGRFRFHGAGKDYYRAWEDFLTGVTDSEPPEFWAFVDGWREREFGRWRRTRSLSQAIRRLLPRSTSQE